MTVRREIVLKLVYLCCGYIKENHFYTILLRGLKNSFFRTIESVRHKWLNKDQVPNHNLKPNIHQ